MQQNKLPFITLGLLPWYLGIYDYALQNELVGALVILEAALLKCSYFAS